MPTYVAPQYRDDRNRLRGCRSNDKIVTYFPRIPASKERKETSYVRSSRDVSKRKTRMGYLQSDEIDPCEITMDTIKHKLTHPTKTLSSISTSIKEIGSWCPRCYQFYENKGENNHNHEEECTELSQRSRELTGLLKLKFEGFYISLENCIQKSIAENKLMKKQSFFNTDSTIFLENISNVINKIYNRSSHQFLTYKHIIVLTKKINAIFKDV